MPLRNDLLNPISADKPAGENLRYAPVYDKIKEARREEDDAPQGEWKRERKVADWPLVIKLASETLATKTKDLQLCAWLAEAMLRREGITGLREVIDLIHGLIDNFWDDLYPELEDGDAEFRAGPLQWIGDRLEAPLKSAPLTRGKLGFFKYKESRSVGSEETAAESEEKRQARLLAIADGKITLEEFDKDFSETPKAFYVTLLENFDATTESLNGLKEVCDAKFGDVAPTFGTLEKAIEEVRQTVYILLQKKRETEPDEPVAEPEPEPEPEPVYEEAVAQDSGSAAAAARAPIRKGGLTLEPVDRDDAVARVAAAAKFLRQQDAYSPAPYLMLRGLRWGELRAAGEVIDQMMLAAPPSEIRQQIKKLSLEFNWTEVLETAETAMAMECGRGWLDLQRYVGRACTELGSYYDPIRKGVIASLRALLADYPQLPEFTMMDDTPTANAETLAWIKENVQPEPAAEAASEAPSEPVYAMPMEQQAEVAAEAAAPDPFELAMQAARSGRAQEAIEMMMREMAQERSGRARFHRKVQVAQLCVSTGHDNIAFPILQELASEVERRKLEDWEAPDLVAHPLTLLYRCLAKAGGSEEERQRLYSWICRLDPVQALNVSR
ncbi:MAG TPA: type VI secretion system protein TssA [Bryobacteraceae bacterium]|nr:type VI secretion system protein TssA [Bryobacteraceae bacterium]